MKSFPKIRIEIEGLRASLIQALSEQSDIYNKYVEEAVEKFLNEGYIKEAVIKEAQTAFDKALRDAVRSFFAYGPGKKAIEEVVHARLTEELDMAVEVVRQNLRIHFNRPEGQ